MRTINLSAEEANIVFTVLNRPADPRVGLTMQEIRKGMPILDKIEETAEKEIVKDPNGNILGERLAFHPVSLGLSEEDFEMLKGRIDNSSGWESMQQGRQADTFFKRLKDIPAEAEQEDTEKGTKGKKG